MLLPSKTMPKEKGEKGVFGGVGGFSAVLKDFEKGDRRRTATFRERRKTYKKELKVQLDKKQKEKEDQGWFKKFINNMNGMDFNNIQTQMHVSRIEKKEAVYKK